MNVLTGREFVTDKEIIYISVIFKCFWSHLFLLFELRFGSKLFLCVTCTLGFHGIQRKDVSRAQSITSGLCQHDTKA